MKKTISRAIPRLNGEIEPVDIAAERCAAFAQKSGMTEEDMGEILNLTDREFENIFGHAPRQQVKAPSTKT